MRLRNTSSYPDDEVRELVEFASRGVNMAKVCVNVKGTSGQWAGAAYHGVPDISNAPPSTDYLVTLRIAPADTLRLPKLDEWYLKNRRAGDGREPGRWPVYDLLTWQEVLVHLAAHEARHVHQFRRGKRCSEIDCERFAVKAVERWRATIREAVAA